MKKLAVIFVSLVAVAIISFLWLRGQMGVADAARLVPSGTVVFASFPDLPRAIMRWPKTTLAAIGAEPEVRAFLEKPLAALEARPAKKETQDLLLALKPGRVFLSAARGADGRISPLIGVQFWGGRGDFEKAAARLRAQIYGDTAPEPKRESIDGVEVTSTTGKTGETIYSAETARWGFLTNNRETLADALARARSKVPGPSLADDPDFARCMVRLLPEPDFLGFARPGPLLDGVLEFGATLGATPDPGQVAPLRQAAAIGFCLKMDGADLRDAVFVLRPGAPDAGKLDHFGMNLTSPSTLAYFNILVPPTRIKSVASHPAVAPVAERNPAINRILEKATSVLGNQVAVVAGWPEGGMLPDGVLAVSLADPAQAEPLLMEAGSLLPEVTVEEAGGVKYFGFPSLRSPFLDPTLAISGNMLLAANSPASIAYALENAGAASPLSAGTSFAPALAAYGQANEAFGFVDLKGVFSRAFPMLRGVISFGVSLVPGASDIMDATKLPQTETIAKHLTPLVYSQSRFDDGYLIESSGPITMNQAALLIGGGAGGLLGPRMP